MRTEHPIPPQRGGFFSLDSNLRSVRRLASIPKCFSSLGAVWLVVVMVIGYAIAILSFLPFYELLFPGHRRTWRIWFPRWLPSLSSRDPERKPRMFR